MHIQFATVQIFTAVGALYRTIDFFLCRMNSKCSCCRLSLKFSFLALAPLDEALFIFLARYCNLE
jgi:hypothetical protein